MGLTFVGGKHLEAETVNFNAFTAVRNMFESIAHQAAHRLAIVIFQVHAEEIIELIEIRLSLHAPALVIDRRNVVFAEI